MAKKDKKSSGLSLGRGAKKFKPAKPTVPSVNLLPPRLEFEKTKRLTKRSFAIVSAGFITSCGLLLGGQLVLNYFADEAVSAKETELAELDDRIGQYSGVESFVNSIETRNDLIRQLQGDQMNYVTVSNALFDVLPANATIANLTMSVLANQDADAIALAATCGPVVDPIGISEASIVGCLKSEVSVPVGANPAALAEALQASPLLVNVAVDAVVSDAPAPADGQPAAPASQTITITAAVVQEGLLRTAPAPVQRPTTDESGQEAGDDQASQE